MGRAVSTSHAERLKETSEVRAKWSDPAKIPVVVEPADARQPPLAGGMCKFLIPATMTVQQVQMVIRKKLTALGPDEALFMFAKQRRQGNPAANPTMLVGSGVMADVDASSRSDDGFLYLVYARENVFGS